MAYNLISLTYKTICVLIKWKFVAAMTNHQWNFHGRHWSFEQEPSHVLLHLPLSPSQHLHTIPRVASIFEFPKQYKSKYHGTSIITLLLSFSRTPKSRKINQCICLPSRWFCIDIGLALEHWWGTATIIITKSRRNSWKRRGSAIIYLLLFWERIKLYAWLNLKGNHESLKGQFWMMWVMVWLFIIE